MGTFFFKSCTSKIFYKNQKKILSALIFFALAEFSFGQTKPLYQLPENLPEKKSVQGDSPFLIGTDAGLFQILPSGIANPLWIDGKVQRILKTSARWFFLTDRGVVSSADLKSFAECNDGLPYLTVKKYDGKQNSLVKKPALLKDIAADPFDPDVLVTATKNEVFVTRDGGKSWASIGSTSRNTAGLKAVAVSHMPVYSKDGEISGSEIVVFMSHPIYGFSYYRLDAKKPAWIDVSAGFAIMPSLTQVDEIADIIPVLCKDSAGNVYSEIYLSQSFLPNVYRFNWKTKKGEKIYQGENPCDTIDGLCQTGSSLIFSTVGKISSLSLADGKISDVPNFSVWSKKMNSARSIVNSAFIPESETGLENPLELKELWLLNPDVILTPWGEKSNGKKAVYTSVYQLRTMEGIVKYKKIIAENSLNAAVIDMKDDYGLLRFEPNNPDLKEKGKVTQYKINVEQVVDEMKKDGIYLIARIVVFKDRNLAAYSGGKYAVWNAKTNSPWVGIRGKQEGETGTSYYDENWVDPYSEEVWEYNIEIARELIERGFDEIQFDYIRFPTDGINLGSAVYRWKSEGMDKESALVSFLSYARENIDAPIGIDIYGANGWYRSGTRTGQDVELMSEYVDVICPMFYPSHFEQDFLEYKPFEERAYRIYFFGSYRNTVIGRNRIVVRPWVQAFKMNVRHDRAYYNKNYVLREIFGVRDGLNRGYMYWNNSGGNYEDISPDPKDSEISPWHQNECDLQKRIPAFSSGAEKNSADSAEQISAEEKKHSEQMISIWNHILERENESEFINPSQNFLFVEPLGAHSGD